MKHLLRANKDSFSGSSLFIFLVRFVPSLASVLVIIFYSRTLTEHDYGNYQNFWTRLFIFSTIACLGLQTFLLTYPAQKLAAILRSVRSSFYYIFSAWIVVVGIAFVFFQGISGIGGLLLPFGFIIIYSLGIISESLLITLRRFSVLIPVNTIHAIVFCILHWLVVSWQYSLTVLFYWLMAAAFLRLCILGAAAFKGFSRHQNDKSVIAIGQVRTLWMHIGIYDVSQMLFRWIDKFIVSIILSKALFAVYFNGSIDIPFLPLILGAVGSAALMQMSQQHQEDNSYAIQLLLKKGRVLSSVVFPLFFFFLFFRYELFSVLLSQKYLAAVPVFLVSIMAIPLRAYSFTTVLQNRHKGAVINIGAVADLLLACALIYPLYQLMGLPGIALGFVISSYLQAAYYLYHTAGVLGTSVLSIVPFTNWLIKLLLFLLLFIGIHYFLSALFQQDLALLLGVLATAVIVVISLSFELRLVKKG